MARLINASLDSLGPLDRIDPSMFKPLSAPTCPAQLITEVSRALQTLKDRDRKIVMSLCGFGGVEATQAELGRKYNISRQRIRQIYLKALNQLRPILAEGIDNSST